MTDQTDAKTPWRQPDKTSSSWRRPTVRTSRPQDTGWRTPTMPENVDPAPQSEGNWHLPAVTDTTAKPASEEQAAALAPRPEDLVLADSAASPRPEDFAVPPEDVVVEPTEEAVEAPRPEDELLDDTAAEVTEDLSELEDEFEDAVDELEDDDDEAFSMSELIALQNLSDASADEPVERGADSEVPVDTAPTVEVDTGNLSPAERAALGGVADTSQQQDYISQQLAALEGDTVDDTASMSGTTPMPAADEDDPAAIARRQIEALQGGDPGDAFGGTQPTPVVPGAGQQYDVDPQTEALAQDFLEREQQIHELRNQRDQGLITQAQLQDQLRSLMVLDEREGEGVWWMMGVDSDIWYKYVGDNWIIAQPPRPAGYRQQSAAPTDTGQLDPNEVIQGSLPYMPGNTEVSGEYTSPDAYGGYQDDYTPVDDFQAPGAVPTQDPGATVPGNPAIYQYDNLPSSEATVQNPAVQGFDDTFQTVDSIEAPYDEEVVTAPDYELDEEGDIYRDAVERQQRSLAARLGIVAVVLVGMLLIGLAAVGVTGGLWYSSISDRWAADVAGLATYEPAFQTAIIRDIEGAVIAELSSGGENAGARVDVSLDQMSPYMIHAAVSLEDPTFFVDPGWSLRELVNAFMRNLTGGTNTDESSITREVVRRLIFANSPLFDQLQLSEADRDLNEEVVAAEVSQQYSKESILELYLNEVHFGNLAYGVEAAAQFYFEKSASELNLPESAFLAGLIDGPATFDPVTNREAAFDRMDVVLNQMVAVGCLTSFPNQPGPFCVTNDDVRNAAVEKAELETREYLPREATFEYPHFVTFVQAQLENDFTSDQIFRRGFDVTTTLNPRIQDAAENALDQGMAVLVDTGVNTGSIMVTDPRTGAIRAMVGSPDFENADIDGQVNGALTWQQPGSSIKPVTYTAAIDGVLTDAGEEYYTPATILWDVPTTFPSGEQITNFDGQYRGAVSVRAALQNSYNVPAVKAYFFIGDTAFQNMARRLGLTFLPEAQFTPATGLGITEVRLFDMMQAYGTLANDGQRVNLYAIERIVDASGNPVEIPGRAEGEQVVSPQVAYLMQDILSDDEARQPQFGVNTQLAFREFPGAVAAKSGTTAGSRDLWTMGFTNNVVVGVWMGRPDNGETFGTSGYRSAAPVWNSVIREAIRGSNPERFQNPGGVVARQVCATTGTIPDDTCTNVRNALVIDAQPPPPPSEGFVVQIPIDTWTGVRANDLCPDSTEIRSFANIEDQSALNWLQTTAQGQQYARLVGIPLPIQLPPQQECDLNTPILRASISSPVNGGTINQPLVSVQGTVGADNLQQYEIQVAPASAPESFTTVDGPFTSTVASGPLGEWDTTGFANGEYILRLSMTSQQGGTAFRTNNVTLMAPTPTPTPTVPVVPTLPPTVEFSTPLPFDSTPIPFDDTLGG